MTDRKPKRILLTAARSFTTLDLARQLRANGHEIFVAETTRLHVCRFSNAITKSFKTPSPRFQPKAFVDCLIKIAEEEKIDLIIPIYEEIIYLSKERHRFPSACEIFTDNFETLHQLHNKWLFTTKLESLGIATPKAYLIKSQADLEKIEFSKPFALKACYSRASLNLKKIIPGQPLPNLQIEVNNPWIAQEWLEGNRFCTYSIAYKGKVQAHATYPVSFAIDGNSCLTYEAVHHQPILKWVEKFVHLMNFTGQIAFDFIEGPNGLFAIECNPRATSGLHLFTKRDRIDLAFLRINQGPIYAKQGTKQQVATGMMMYGWRKSALPSNSILKFLKALFSVKDVVFSSRDLKPFLLQPLIFTGILLKSKRAKLSIPASFTSDSEWNGE